MENSLNDPTRCRIHSRATKIGQRMWKRKALCSNGVPWRSRMRNRIRPSSASSITSLRRANETRAAFTTERSLAMESSSRTKPWSSTSMVFSGITSVVTVTRASLAPAHVGASGFSYPSWKGGFYAADAKPEEFLRAYSERLSTVELNNTFYRLPEEGQFERWAEQTPPGFRFAVTMTRRFTGRIEGLDTFVTSVRRLGDRLGPLRIKAPQMRDDGYLLLLFGSLDPDLQIALDFRHESWDDPAVQARLDERGAVRVGAVDRAASFRYLRFRDPPYDEAGLARLADEIRPLLESGIEVFGYFKHEDEPTAPRYAERLVALLAPATTEE